MALAKLPRRSWSSSSWLLPLLSPLPSPSSLSSGSGFGGPGGPEGPEGGLGGLFPVEDLAGAELVELVVVHRAVAVGNS